LTDTRPVPRTTILTTPRLVLTTWEPEDVNDLLTVHSDPMTMRFVRHGRPETKDETADLIAIYRAEQAQRGWTKWRLADHLGHLLGRAGFGEHGQDRELGYTLKRDRWGQGLASEIAVALVEWHRERAAVNTLCAYAATENTPSCRVLEKAGFVRSSAVDHHNTMCHLYRIP
jgi:ribosomal-protein-alanine N-acetyltransferase